MGRSLGGQCGWSLVRKQRAQDEAGGWGGASVAELARSWNLCWVQREAMAREADQVHSI